MGQQLAVGLGGELLSLGGVQPVGCSPAEGAHLRTGAHLMWLSRKSVLMDWLLRSLNDVG